MIHVDGKRRCVSIQTKSPGADKTLRAENTVS